MEPTADVELARAEYMQLATALWVGTEPLAVAPMRDRDIFDFLGFD
jgi:light-independent protochlorophyllide reductase subunit L